MHHINAPLFGDDRSWFDILYQNPEDVVDFQEFLGKFAKPFIDAFVAEYDFGQHQRFLDIGSGIGTTMAVVDKFHSWKPLFASPQASSFLHDKLGQLGYGERIAVIEGDVINGLLPNSEFDNSLGWMLHDYDHDTQMTILGNIYQAMPVGGRFIASETPLNDAKTGEVEFCLAVVKYAGFN